MNTYLSHVDFEAIDKERLATLCGEHDSHLRLIEQRLNVSISGRGGHFQISGSEIDVKKAINVLQKLYAKSDKHAQISPNEVHLQLSDDESVEINAKDIKVANNVRNIATKVGLISGRTSNQREYLERIQKHDVNFGIGPAGTGKTYLAVASAVAALESQEVRRLLLVRPAVEAGERLGFLPGDLVQKIEPYLRPLYDALYEMLGFDKVTRLIEQNIIEIAPLAYMRGRTLNDAFIILDEGQNTTTEQMKMFLTRLGFGSKAIITGDITQVDLPRDKKSGLVESAEILKSIPGISFTFFTSKDVVRHHLVQKIIEAYESFDLRKDNKKDGKD